MKRDYLTFEDLSAAEVHALLARARELKRLGKKSPKSLEGQVLGLIFEKESTRTRISFEVAAHRLGAQPIYLSQQSSQLSRGETYSDTARVLSRYLDGLVLRTYSQEGLEELAQHAAIPVINGLTDLHHPCQILADLLTILEKKGDLRNQRIVYLGDGNNMANTWIEAALLLDLTLTVACPKGFFPSKEILARIKNHSKIKVTADPLGGIKDADVINTDTWFSMGQKVSAAKRKKFKNFQVNTNLLKKAAPGAIVLHCLPAHRGEEISDEVLDGSQSVVFDEAENRLHVQMALLEKLMG